MTQTEALKLALDALETFHYTMIDAGVLDRQEVFNQGFTAATAIKEALAQPEQEPVIGTKTWFEDGKVVTQHLTAKDIYKDPEQPEQEPVAFLTNHRQRMNVQIKPEAFVWMPTTTDWEVPLYTTPPQRKPLPKGEWPKHPSGYVGDVYKGYDKSDLDNYAMQVLAAHGIKE